MADLSDAAGTVRDTIGRYFSVVSAIPSALLVVWVFLLVGSGAWSGDPDPDRAVDRLSSVGFGGAVGLVLASLALGLLLHPVQFALVQVLEGYWGASPLIQRIRHLAILRHRARERRLFRAAIDHATAVARCESELSNASGERLAEAERNLLAASSWLQEVQRLAQIYPAGDRTAIMPTRLGNVLRRYEWSVGQVYNLDVVTVMPYLSRVAAPGDMEYVNDQRSQLDLAVRMTFVALLASAVTAVFLARHGLWMLVTLVPYCGAYLAYRGAVVAAAEYGRSLSVVVALNRFALYERLRLAPPENTTAERTRNDTLQLFLLDRGTIPHTLTYGTPPTGRAQGPGGYL